MRIALFTETFLPKVDGIVTRLRFTIAELQRQGHEVLVFAPGEGCTEYAGARVVRLSGHRFFLYPELTLALPRSSIGRELHQFKPDVLHAADASVLGLAALYYSRMLHFPLVLSYHTRLPQYVRYYGLRYLEPLAWTLIRTRHSFGHVNLCTSNAMCDELRVHGIPRLHLWPPAVDTELFHPRFQSAEMRTRLTAGRPDRPLLLYVGRLSPEKDVERLRTVLNRYPDAHLAIVGGGPHQAALEKHFAGSNTVFAGYMKGKTLAAAMASADALILPSQTETLGLVLTEGMAAGTVVIGARAGGVTDIIRDGVTGFLFAPGSDSDLIDAAAKVIEGGDHIAAIRSAARRQAEQWSWANSTSTLVGYYRQAIRTLRVGALRPRLRHVAVRMLLQSIRTLLP